MNNESSNLILKKNNKISEVIILFSIFIIFTVITPVVYINGFSNLFSLTIGISTVAIFIVFLSGLFNTRVVIKCIGTAYFLGTVQSVVILLSLEYQIKSYLLMAIVLFMIIIGFAGVRLRLVGIMVRYYKKSFKNIIFNGQIEEDKLNSSKINKSLLEMNKKTGITKYRYGRYIGFTFFIVIFLLTGGSKYGGGAILHSILPENGTVFIVLGAFIALNISIWPEIVIGHYISQKAFNELRKEYAENQHFHFSNKPN